MKLTRITQYDIHPITPIVYKTKQGKKYLNILLGTLHPHGKKYTIKLESQVFDVDNPKELLEDTYILKPFIRNKKPETDKHDNINYVLTKDSNSIHKKDVLLIWEIPNNNYLNITYNLQGSCQKLVEAVSGRSRTNNKLTAPCLLIEVLGDCKLEWRGVDLDGRQVSQTIDYDYNKGAWNIRPIEVKDMISKQPKEAQHEIHHKQSK